MSDNRERSILEMRPPLPHGADTAAALIPSVASGEMNLQWADVAAELFIDSLKGLSPAERKREIHKMIHGKTAEIKLSFQDRDDKLIKLNRLKRVRAAYLEVQSWSATGVRLERAAESQFRELRKAVGQGKAHHVVINSECDFPSTDYEKEYFRHAEIFLVQHDWSGALKNATDFEGSPFHLPFETCAFEFQVSGRRVIALATEIDDRVAFTPAVWTSTGWLIPGFVYWSDGDVWSANQRQLDVSEAFDAVVKAVGDGLRAISIALDAEVAVTEVERHPHHRAEAGSAQTAPKPYHIVSLARRSRAPALEGASGTGTKKRLHFRRGHWRHFETHKTWIKWMLVGNPDMGFVDKEYRL